MYQSKGRHPLDEMSPAGQLGMTVRLLASSKAKHDDGGDVPSSSRIPSWGENEDAPPLVAVLPPAMTHLYDQFNFSNFCYRFGLRQASWQGFVGWDDQEWRARVASPSWVGAIVTVW